MILVAVGFAIMVLALLACPVCAVLRVPPYPWGPLVVGVSWFGAMLVMWGIAGAFFQ